jgi:hypothetical protein
MPHKRKRKATRFGQSLRDNIGSVSSPGPQRKQIGIIEIEWKFELSDFARRNFVPEQVAENFL